MSKKKKFKIVSIVTTLFVMMTLISLKGLITKATVASRPEFDIEFDNLPEEEVVDKYVEITGKIKPKPFEVNIENIDTEIIIVIDRNTTNKQGMGEVLNSLRKSIGEAIRGTSLTGKIKFGLIDYTTYANIYKYNNNAIIDINDRNKIAEVIENFKREDPGYSNTGEALRKATYLLESSKSDGIKNKIVILFSDGTPTARTVDSNGEFYLNTSSESYDGGQIKTSINNYTEDIEYAKTVGNIIRKNGYTAYTVGYNVKNEEEASILREIHKSMTGDTLDDKFYVLDDKKITEEIKSVFNDIEKDIVNTYPLNNIEMNLNFTGDFSLNIGGNTVTLNNVEYKLVSTNNGKARYEADEIPFKFIIKGNKEGYQQILDKITITYPWKDSIEKVDINSELFITIKSNELPSIVPKLISSDKIEVEEEDKKNEVIDVVYQINPESYLENELNSSDIKSIEEVIIIADLSQKMSTGNRETIIKNQIANVILKRDNLKFTKFGFIGYNENHYIADINEKNNPKNVSMKNPININNLITPLFDISGGDSWDGFRIIFQEGKYSISNNNIRNIDQALITANDVFDIYGKKDAGKALVIINTGDVNYSEEVASMIKERGYKIISLDISDENNTNLKKFHEDLGGIYSTKENESDYLRAILNGGNYNDSNDYGPRRDMEKIADRLSQGVKVEKVISISPNFNFDLNNKFEYVKDSNDNLVLLNEDGNKLQFKLNTPIIYTNSGEKIEDKYKFTALPQTISFKVKLKEKDETNFTFGINNIDKSSNYMSYNNFSNKELQVMLQTPIVKILKSNNIEDLNHGLYNGIINGQVSISETNSGNAFEIAQGSTVTFGATFTLNSSTNFKLNVDKNIQGVDKDNIKIYQISNGKLVNIEDKEISGENNEFNISINVGNNTEILVVYQGKVTDSTSSGQTLTNDIVFSNISKKATIVTPQESDKSPILPDLF